jgi:hypothetical protein
MKSSQKIRIGSVWTIEHWRDGRKLSERIDENLCPDEYIDYFLGASMAGVAPVTSWYILLFSDNHTPAVGDTYAIPGFTEAVGYDEATRPVWDDAGVSAKSMTNTASKASFTMDGTDATIYGAALVSDSTKGDQAASGAVLGPVAIFSEGAITGIIDNDVLKVVATLTGYDVE